MTSGSESFRTLIKPNVAAGRTRADEVFIFDSTGTALQDVAAARLVYERALAVDAGRRTVLDDRAEI